MNKFVAPHFLKILSDMYKDYGFVHYWGLVAGISLGIFFVAVIVDKARIIVWNALWKRIERKWLISQ